MNINKLSKKEFVEFIRESFDIAHPGGDPANIRVNKPDLFVASFLADEYKDQDPEIQKLIAILLRKVGRKVLKVRTNTHFKNISRLTCDNRLQCPHNDILDIMKVISRATEPLLQDKYQKISFEPLIKEYHESVFVIHDQCVSDGTTTLNLHTLLKPFNIRMVGTDVAMHYYFLTSEGLCRGDTSGVNEIDNLSGTEEYDAALHDQDLCQEGAMFDHTGSLKQIKYGDTLIQYYHISRNPKMLKDIASNFLQKIRYRDLARQYTDLFVEMKGLLDSDTHTVREQGGLLRRKNFLNPESSCYPEVVFTEHDISLPFREQRSIITVFNALTLNYFVQSQVEIISAVLCAGLKDGGLLFVGEGEFDGIAYSVFQKRGNALQSVYDVGNGAGVRDIILSASSPNT